MMTHTYYITGMTCNSCVVKVKSEILKLGAVTEAQVQLAAPQASITMQDHVPLHILQQALSKAGAYTITEAGTAMHGSAAEDATARSWLSTYTPILLIGAYITGLTLLVSLLKEGFDMERWMNHFMAAFFLVFSFFKLLNLKGFAAAYSMYDVLAKKWPGWGYLYPFIELALGIAFLLGFDPLLVNGVTFVVMSVSIIGVLQSVIHKRNIRCACLGVLFKQPMSTITIIEDALMISMSAVIIIKELV